MEILNATGGISAGNSILPQTPTPCPHCGHCPTCGRGGHFVAPSPYGPSQTWPWITWSGNNTWKPEGWSNATIAY